MEILSKDKREKVIDWMVEQLDSDYETEMERPWQKAMSREEYLFDTMSHFDFFQDWVFLEYEEDGDTYVCYLPEIKTSRGDDLTQIVTVKVDNDYNVLGYIYKETKVIPK